MADKSIADLPVSGSMTDDALLALYQNGTTNSITGALIKSYAQNAVASQVTAAQTAANQAGQSATQAEAARQGAAAAQTAAENAQDAAETARDQSVAAAGTIGDSVEQAQTAAGQASSAKDDAVAAQTAAETAKTAAETASGQAKTAATQAAGSATAAQTAATQAGDAKTDAETARNEAETSASSAANSASDAESAATEAEQAKTYIENMDMEGETLPSGSSVTVTKTTSPEGNLLFVIGVPQGIQGDKGDTGETGATGPQGVSVTNATVNEDGDLVITLSSGSPINTGSVIGPQGIQGEVGPTGASVDRIERTSGTGAPGTTDTYTVYLTNGQTGGTFQVYNGSNGTGSGDFMADGSVPMTGDLQMGGHAVTGMADGTDPTDGATVGQLAGKLDSPDGGTAGQVLTKTADGSAWENAPSGLPAGGTEGQMLYKSANGAEWGDKPVMYVNITTSGAGFSADKTAQEIYEAVQKGFFVFAKLLGEQTIPLFQYTNDSSMFYKVTFDGGVLISISGSAVEIQGADLKASGVSFTPTSTLTSDNVQDAIEEVQENVENVLPTGGTPGQVLTKTSTGEEWSDAPSGLPEGGTEGQMLYKSADGAAWGDKPVMYVNVTMSDGTTGTADKTPGEIFNAFNAGYVVYARLENTVALPFVSGNDSISTFIMTARSYSTSATVALTVNASGNVKITETPLATLGVDGKVPASQLPDMDYIPTSQKGAASGVAELDSTGRVPSSQLPSYVDDVMEYNTLSSFPPTGEDGKVYIAEDTNLQYRWSGTQYVEISPSLALGETSSTAYRGDRGKTAYDHSQITTGNPHGTTAADVGAVPTTRTINGHALSDNVSLTAGDVGAATPADVNAAKPALRTATLTPSGWSSNTQTVTVSGVSATETAQLITPTPAIASQSAYYEAGIMCTGQAANSLTFTCQTVPTSNLTVYVVIQPLG